MRSHHTAGPCRRWIGSALLASLLATACSAGDSANVSAPDSSTPAPHSEATAAPNSTAAVQPTPSPTPEPTATPAPAPPVLAIERPDGSGLVELHLDDPAPWPLLGVSIDGVLRAVAAAPRGRKKPVATVWVPPGMHDVCVGPVEADATPTYWDDGTARSSGAASPTGSAEQTCMRVAGRLDARTTIFPGSRVIAHYGSGVTAALGVLGEGPPQRATERLVEATAAFAEFDLPTVPAFEYIVTVAQGRPGDDGLYSYPWPPEGVRRYLELVREVGGIVVLDLQPGRAGFIDQARDYEELLLEPDVHLALDPEWSMDPDGVPGRRIGRTDAATVNEVLAYVQDLVVRHGLPQKLVVVHQFLEQMVENREEIGDPEGIAVVFHVDGQGPVGAKYGTYDELSVEPPFFNGFKVFFDEDSRVMTPAEVVAIEPSPVYISYQ